MIARGTDISIGSCIAFLTCPPTLQFRTQSRLSFLKVMTFQALTIFATSFEGEGLISLIDARHPCLELQDGVVFISNGTEFNKGTVLFLV